MRTLTFSTSQNRELVDITAEVEKAIAQQEIRNGICHLFTPHSTAALMIQENESGLQQDFIDLFEKLDHDKDWQHNRIDNNAAAHLWSGIVGPSRTLPLENQSIVRGTWQKIFLVELDGPRDSRRVIIQILKQST